MGGTCPSHECKGTPHPQHTPPKVETVQKFEVTQNLYIKTHEDFVLGS